MAQAPTYTDEQLELYLERIKYPHSAQNDSHRRLHHVRNSVAHDALSVLADLQRHILAAIPWGNSALHYSQHHTISLNPRSLFEKMVMRRLDGYCMENTGIFLIVLRSLGYHVYATGARVSHAATGVDDGLYLAFGHMVLIVLIDGRKYMVDVGFGSNCATAPLPLEEGAIATCIEPSEMRLVRESIREFTDKSQTVWVYQTKHDRYYPQAIWLPGFCFSEEEFLLQDFEVMNFSVSLNRTSWFTQVFVCVRMILDESGSEIIGQTILSGKEVKRRVHGKTEILQVLQNEQDRVRALSTYFDMHLHEDEIQGIRGLASELR